MDKPNSLQYVLSSNIYRVYPHQPTNKQIRLGHMALHWDAYSAGRVGFCGSIIQLSYFYLIKTPLGGTNFKVFACTSGAERQSYVNPT